MNLISTRSFRSFAAIAILAAALSAQSTTRVSLGSNGYPTTLPTWEVAMSADGRFIQIDERDGLEIRRNLL